MPIFPYLIVGFTTAAKFKNCSGTSKFNRTQHATPLQMPPAPCGISPRKASVMRTWFCRGGSSRCEDPAPTVGRWRGILPRATIYAHGEAIARIANQPFLPLGRCAIINRNSVEVDNDAARRVATSSEKRENRFKPPYSKRETAAKGPSPMPIPCPARLPPMNLTVFIATRSATSLQTAPAPVSRFAVAGRLADLPPKRRRKPPVVRVRHRRLRVDIYSGPRRR